VAIRSHLKNRILVQVRGGVEFKTAGIRWYFEDFKRGTNPARKGGRPKDIFEIASNNEVGVKYECRKSESFGPEVDLQNVGLVFFGTIRIITASRTGV